MSLCYWNRSFPQEWQNCQNLHFLTLRQGNYTPSNYTQKCFKLCWTVFLHLIEFSVPYTFWHVISKNDCFEIFSLLSSCCYRRCVQCFPGDSLFICENCLFYWMIVDNHFRMASWFWYHRPIFTEIGIFWESEKSFSVADSSMQ